MQLACPPKTRTKTSWCLSLGVDAYATTSAPQQAHHLLSPRAVHGAASWLGSSSTPAAAAQGPLASPFRILSPRIAPPSPMSIRDRFAAEEATEERPAPSKVGRGRGRKSAAATSAQSEDRVSEARSDAVAATTGRRGKRGGAARLAAATTATDIQVTEAEMDTAGVSPLAEVFSTPAAAAPITPSAVAVAPAPVPRPHSFREFGQRYIDVYHRVSPLLHAATVSLLVLTTFWLGLSELGFASPGFAHMIR